MARALFAVVRQIQTYFGVLTCLVGAGLLRVLFSGQTYADLVVFELYTTAQANLLFALVAPVLMVWLPTTTIFVASPVLLIGLHALAGPDFFGQNRKGLLLPPLAVSAALITMMVIFAIGGAVGGLLLVL